MRIYHRWFTEHSDIGFDTHLPDYVTDGWRRKEPKRGPHEGKEMQLMLLKRKPCALIFGGYLNYWEPYIKNKIFKFGSCHQHSFIVTQPEESWRIDAIKRTFRMYKNSKISIENYHIRLGRLLGYSKSEILFFIRQ